jgi:hypothetical protein
MKLSIYANLDSILLIVFSQILILVASISILVPGTDYS